MRNDSDRLVVDVVDYINDECVESLVLPHEPFSLPHANVCCLGRHKYSVDSIVPQLYVSQWSYKSEKGVMVYDLYWNHAKVCARLIQVIIPKVSTEYIGFGSIDWVVDVDRDELFSFAYKKEGASTIETDNEEIVTVYNLPAVGEQFIVELSDKDVVRTCRFPTFNYSQDKCYHNNRIFIVSGGDSLSYAHMNKLRVLNVLTGQLEIEQSIFSTGMGLREPERLCFHDDILLLTYLSGSNVLWRCSF